MQIVPQDKVGQQVPQEFKADKETLEQLVSSDLKDRWVERVTLGLQDRWAIMDSQDPLDHLV